MIFLEFYYKIQASHLRNFSKKGENQAVVDFGPRRLHFGIVNELWAPV